MGIVAGHAADVAYGLLAAMAKRFESLILKIKVKDAKDLDDNWEAKVLCQHAYV